MINYNDFIIDFDRLNALTAHPNDNPNASGFTGPAFLYSVTRKVLKDYMEIWTSYNGIGAQRGRVTEDQYKKVCEVLHYNRILISKSDSREQRIDSILTDDDGSTFDPF